MFNERTIEISLIEKLWKRYYDRFLEALGVGYNPKIKQYDPSLAHALKYNIAEFSAFKETSFRKQLEKLLTKNGKIVPWSEFKKEAFAISEDYNKRWLETEYHHTVATANMTAKWADFERNKDLYPNLRYVTAGDSRVREKHAAWDGLVLPMDHSWWKTHYPPQDYGCRCDAVQTDEDVSKDVPTEPAKKGFDNNAAKTGRIWNGNPYEDDLTKEEARVAKKFSQEQFKKETEKEEKKA